MIGQSEKSMRSGLEIQENNIESVRPETPYCNTAKTIAMNI